MANKCFPWWINEAAATDTGTHLKCFRWTTNQPNRKIRTDLLSRCFSRIPHRSNRKINVMPSQEEVSNEIAQSVPKEEHVRVLQEMNSLKDQLSQKDEEIDMLQKHISEKHERVDLFQPGSFQFSSYESQIGQNVPKVEYDRVLQERNSLDDQLHQKDEETIELKKQISEKDEQLDILKSEVRGLKDDLEWLLLYSEIDPWIQRSILGSLNKTKDNTGEGSKQPVTGSHVTSRYKGKEGGFGDKNRVKIVDRDIIGATPTPTTLLSSNGTPTFLLSCGETPPKAATPTTERLPMSYYSHAEIFRTLKRKGIIPPPSSSESRPIYHQTYYKGSLGHSTENFSHLRLQTDISSDKIEPPEGVVTQNSCSADQPPSSDETSAGLQ